VVLLADDDPDVLEIMRHALKEWCETLLASSAAEAEALLRIHDVKVLICDDDMPGETGLMLMARIRNEFPLTRRILLTGNIDPDVLIYAVNEAGIFKYLSKPFQVRDLVRLVEEGISSFDDAREAAAALQENKDLKFELDKPSRVAGFGLRMLFWGVIALAVLFVSGIILLLLLYVLKTFLGIDIFKDMHFKDLFG
jgi:DNA-binding NtrC family response regulator